MSHGGVRQGAGRPKGSKNKSTHQREVLLNKLADEGGIERIWEELKKLEGKDYIDGITKLLEYVLPKLSRTQSEVSVRTPLTVIEDPRAIDSKASKGLDEAQG